MNVVGALGGDASGIELEHRGPHLPSRFDLDGLAVAALAAAGSGASALHAARNGGPAPVVRVDARAAAASFVSERLIEPIGWELPEIWDAIAGDYCADGGWIRLHTNYERHRAAVLEVLDCPARRDEVERAVRGWNPEALESAVVAAGGAAAVLQTAQQWASSVPGSAVAGAPLVERRDRELRVRPKGPGELPFSGVRVLDLTRVIAGPVCTQFLAAYGADVLRIDPPGFAEVPALLPMTTAGKHCTALDLAAPRGREHFAALLAEADLIVCGLRDGALDRLGLGQEELLAINPALLVTRLNAYGWAGPWQKRRGFDSLVQMTTGLADAGPGQRPDPLPAQALDHAAGLILAGAVGHALAGREEQAVACEIRISLAAVADLLLAAPADSPEGAGQSPDGSDTVRTETEWGPVMRVPVPTVIEGISPVFTVPAGPLGRHEARWQAAR